MTKRPGFFDKISDLLAPPILALSLLLIMLTPAFLLDNDAPAPKHLKSPFVAEGGIFEYEVWTTSKTSRKYRKKYIDLKLGTLGTPLIRVEPDMVPNVLALCQHHAYVKVRYTVHEQLLLRTLYCVLDSIHETKPKKMPD